MDVRRIGQKLTATALIWGGILSTLLMMTLLYAFVAWVRWRFFSN